MYAYIPTKYFLFWNCSYLLKVQHNITGFQRFLLFRPVIPNTKRRLKIPTREADSANDWISFSSLSFILHVTPTISNEFSLRSSRGVEVDGYSSFKTFVFQQLLPLAVAMASVLNLDTCVFRIIYDCHCMSSHFPQIRWSNASYNIFYASIESLFLQFLLDISFVLIQVFLFFHIQLNVSASVANSIKLNLGIYRNLPIYFLILNAHCLLSLLLILRL